MALRYSLQDIQYSKLFNVYTPKIINRYPKIQNQFDDKKISQSPQAYFNSKKPIISFKMDSQFDSNMRKERIKSKIKNQVRQKIRVIFNRQVKSQLNERRSQDPSSLFQKSKTGVTINKSMVMTAQQLTNKQQIQFKKGDFIVQMKLHHKDIIKRENLVRHRIINSVLQKRRQQKHRRFYEYPAKRSSPILQVSQRNEDKLQPWRFNEEAIIEGPFLKKVSFK